uniref:E3 ubiquitin-protein ligase n=1 Tax=Syphacia muris TaxID=451379 RepID=A0A0N5AYI4_9BILA
MGYPGFWKQKDDKLDEAISKLVKIVRGEEFSYNINSMKKALFVGIVEFLRPLALLFHAITLVPPPEALKVPSYDEFQSLYRYLGFSSDIVELFSNDTVVRLFTSWNFLCQNQDEAGFPTSASAVDKLVRQPLLENSLIELPDDFSELINTAANFRCPTSLLDDHVSSMPTLCLICGSLLCSQSYCCQRVISKGTKGACSFHLQTCSGPSGGIFLRVRDCQIILLTTRARGCFLPAPYVDEFGETDFGFRRGNPLHLNKELYAKLERIWLHQSISEEVVNQNEIDSRNRNEWQHF